MNLPQVHMKHLKMGTCIETSYTATSIKRKSQKQFMHLREISKCIIHFGMEVCME